MAQTNALKLVYLRSVGSIAAGSIVPVAMATRQRGPSNLSATRGLSTNAVSRANTSSGAQLHQSYDLALLTSSSLHNSAQWAAPPPVLLL